MRHGVLQSSKADPTAGSSSPRLPVGRAEHGMPGPPAALAIGVCFVDRPAVTRLPRPRQDHVVRILEISTERRVRTASVPGRCRMTSRSGHPNSRLCALRRQSWTPLTRMAYPAAMCLKAMTSGSSSTADSSGNCLTSSASRIEASRYRSSRVHQHRLGRPVWVRPRLETVVLMRSARSWSTGSFPTQKIGAAARGGKRQDQSHVAAPQPCAPS